MKRISTRGAALILAISLAVIMMCFEGTQELGDPPMVQKVKLTLTADEGGR